MKNLPRERMGFVIWALLCAVLFPSQEVLAQNEFSQRGFTVVAWGEKASDLFFSDATGEHRLSAYPRRRSPYFDYRGSNDLFFYRKGTNEEGEEVRLPAGQFKLSGETRDWLLVFIPETAGRFRILGFPADSMTANEPGYQFINLSMDAIAGVLGGEFFRMEPGKSWVIPAGSINLEGRAARIKLALRREETWGLFYETFWPSRNGERWLIFIYRDEKGEMQLMKIREKIED